jgi:hypothetical protein
MRLEHANGKWRVTRFIIDIVVIDALEDSALARSWNA